MRIVEFWYGYRRLVFPRNTQSAVFRILHESRMTERSLRYSDDSFSFVTDCRTCRVLFRLLHQSGISFRAEPVRGFPCIIAFGRARIGLLFGFTLALALLLFCRSRIWEIRVIGDTSIDEDTIRETLAGIGLSEGMARRRLNADAVSAAYLMRERGVSWMNIHLDGVVAEVEWMAQRPDGETADPRAAGTGANLTAVCDAEIVDLRLTRGTAKVRAGQVVRAGELLVSGVKDDRTVYAEGEVLGRVSRTVSVTVPLEAKREKVTGKVTDAIWITVFGKKLRLFSHGAGEVNEYIPIRLSDNVRLPISIGRGVTYTTEEETYRLSESEAVTAAMRRLSAEVNAFLAEGELLSREVKGEFGEDCYIATAEIQYLINIAKPLEFSVEND